MNDTKSGFWDPYLIRLTIKEKLLLISVTPTVALLLFTLAFIVMDKAEETELQQTALVQHTDSLARTLTGLAPTLDHAGVAAINATLSSGTVLAADSPQMQTRHQLITEGGFYLYSAPVGDSHYLQMSAEEITTASVLAQHTDMLWALAAVVGLTLYLSYVVRRFITRGLAQMQSVMSQAAANDLTVRLDFAPGRDDFRPLAHHIDELIATRQRVVRELREVSARMLGASGELGAQATGSKDLAISQRQHLDSLASAMEEMTATVREVANHAEHTSVETRQASQDAERGHSQIQTTITTITQLVDEVHSASSAVSQVNTNAARIDAVVTTINGISEQTNLLALNAAIEAARAGHQGRGFAVVADEVRSLAGRTQAATVEIQRMIEELQSGTVSLEGLMRSTVERAEQGQELVSRTGEDLMLIAQHSDKVFAMSSQIATAAEQQSTVANDIASNLMEVRNQSHELEQAALASVTASQSVGDTADGLQTQLMGLKI
ncbi:methyl-accepting chemotaxis protein [Ferrimonas balearica]|uniref:methyl-accepting chemotaxis protein n=1 Tax=Ferrimonas balearica TaxID=44012 RepID=UPI001C99F2D8|nr:methyl-accepting chemotaxis protein [Ferrimonas balearica]MBY5991388.1 methyl-accepting chemotaxis protein [Ferrimonas balearica]